MTNQLQSFAFAQGITIRATIRDAQPWFIAKEVCDALDLRVDNATLHLDEDEKTTQPLEFSDQVRRAVLVSESGLYSLIFRSLKPEAKAFRKWLTADVLPALRSGGVYVVGQEKVDLASMTYNQACVHIEAMRAAVGEAEAIRWAKSREEKDARRSGFALLRGGSRRKTRKAIR